MHACMYVLCRYACTVYSCRPMYVLCMQVCIAMYAFMFALACMNVCMSVRSVCMYDMYVCRYISIVCIKVHTCAQFQSLEFVLRVNQILTMQSREVKD